MLLESLTKKNGGLELEESNEGEKRGSGLLGLPDEWGRLKSARERVECARDSKTRRTFSR